MIEADCKLLTEYLGECWHDCENDEECSKCKKTLRGYYFGTHRSFTTREDMMDLYEVIWKKREWEEFCKYMIDVWESHNHYVDLDIPDFTAWLFCLSGEGYDAACQMMADWIKEADHAD